MRFRIALPATEAAERLRDSVTHGREVGERMREERQRRATLVSERIDKEAPPLRKAA